jgi:hypothetical protein
MSLNDIRQFNFYTNYLWSATDFQNLQGWIYDEIWGIANGAFGASTLSGMVVTPAGGMVLNVTQGIGVTSSGRLLVNTTTQNAPAFATPSGNPAKSLLVLRPNDTDGTPVVDPNNPLNTVNLHHFLQAQLVVINGTPASSPSYPAIQANDIVLMGVSLANGQSSIAYSDLDVTVVNAPNTLSKNIKIANGTIYNGLSTDQVVLVKTSSFGIVTYNLPAAASMLGKVVSIVKIDTDNFAVNLVPSGSDTVDTSYLVNQNRVAQLISTGSGWRDLMAPDPRTSFSTSEVSQSIASGSVFTQFSLQIPGSQTWTVAGDLVTGDLIVTGTLVVSGRVISLF